MLKALPQFGNIKSNPLMSSYVKVLLALLIALTINTNSHLLLHAA